ncbi:D-glycerate dehydrogenase [Candidatus Bathyarchaeota archaeon]|nr:MAG: D-glycerate dehydrogenase [Candidatus Bathyarchaeota archaeon]
MPKPKVLVTRKFFDEAIDLIKTVADVEIYPSEEDPIPREVLLDKVQDIDGLLPMLTDRVDQTLLDRGKRLKVVSNYAVGYNNIDVNEATKHGVMVTNTPDVLTDTTADCAFMLLMAISRRLVEVDKFVREGKWVKAWGPKMLLGSDITGKTLGIIGLGRIGKAVVPRAKGFNMKILYHNRNPDPEAEKLGVEYRSMDEILAESDYISLHVPLNDNTKHLIGKPELKKMKKTAYLINTSRGPVVDENALTKALKENRIAGAGLDVLYEEPTNPKNPLLKLDNVIVAPHIGSATIETRLAMAMKAATNLTAALKGEQPPDLLNPEVLW